MAKPLRFLTAVLLFGLAWAQSPAGTVIRNQASATVGGESYLSNVVETEVLPLCAAAMSPGGTPTTPGQRAVAPAGGFAYFAYVLQNAGNAPFEFGLSWKHEPTSWTPVVAFYHDVNANGQRDPGEPLLDRLTLAPGASARLVLEVRLPGDANGQLDLTPVATCPTGEQDADNYARVVVGVGAALNLEKSVDQNLVQPGGEVEFTVRVRNSGSQATAGEVLVGDVLDVPTLGGLRYVAGSAQAPKGVLEYSADGLTWSPTPPTQVNRLRLRLAGLEAGEQAYFTFRMQAEVQAAPGLRSNRARAEGPGGPAEAEAVFQVAARYAHHLGPQGNPRASPGGEGSADDRQQAYAFMGRPLCFTHSLENAGNAPDTYTLTPAAALPAGVSLSLQNQDGAPLAQPLLLGSGQTLDFRACYSFAQATGTAQDFVLEARSTLGGNSNRTTDRVLSVFDPSALRLQKGVDQSVVVPDGSLIYTLRVENTLPFALTGVAVSDTLDPALAFVFADNGGTFDPGTRRVSWNLPSIPANSSLTLTLRVRVLPTAPEGGEVPNRFSLASSEIPQPLESNSVSTQVISARLLLEKSVSPQKAVVGDLLTYTLRLANPGKVALEVRLVDDPAPGLDYQEGSTAFSGTAQAAFEPQPAAGGVLVWAGLRLEPGQALTLTYRMRVMPGAGPELRNVAQAQGALPGGPVVSEAESAALVSVVPGVFAPPDALVGRVFLDADRDGKFTPGRDLPLPGARLVLGNGRQAVTDAEGRYAFREVGGGVWTLLLDPASAPFAPLPHPERLGSGYQHRVRVAGLSVSDFPLEMPLGLARATRETVLEFGPLRLAKRMLPLPGGGERTFAYEVLEGELTLTYDLPAGEGIPSLTDPQVRWRYP
ncbi:DUF11 domain-containing protein [Calidithermus timidus]|uniref:DUF11 domain-containing protein n=1 Tax=Calidithermus timidus TaxID=307124 RepID=UPI000399BE68|nr:DUF11 domain-containing protein [Calidithermus timidus]